MYTKLPKYMKVKQSILDDIQNGTYKPGDTIPSDNELMQLFSVSKSTVTQALKSLSQEGYIIREQGRGSFVSSKESNITLQLYICPTEHKDEAYWTSIVQNFNTGNQAFLISLKFIYNDLIPLRDTLFKAFASGNAPDLFSLDGPDVSYWAYMNSLKSLDSYASSEFKERFLPNIIQQGTYQGKLYHLGYNESTLCILYNKPLFEKLGIKAPKSIQEAWTWTEFVNVCKHIKENSDCPYPLLMDSGRGLQQRQGEWLTYSALPFIFQNEGTVFDPALRKTTGYLNSPRSVEAMDWLGKLYHHYHFTHIEDASELFPQHFAMSLSLPNAFFDVLNENSAPDHIGILPLPKGIRSASLHGGWGLCISSQSLYPEECWKFLEYVFTLENQIKLYKITGMPVLKDIYSICNDFNAISDNTNILFSQLHATSVTRPITPAYPFFSKTFTNAYLNIARGGDAQRILDDAAYQVDDHLVRHHYFTVK